MISEAILNRIRIALERGPMTLDEVAREAGLTYMEAGMVMWDLCVEMDECDLLGEQYWLRRKEAEHHD